MSQKLLIIILIVVVVVLVVAGAVIGMHLSKGDAAGPSVYSAVYLSSGDIYFGKFHSFPSPHMTDVWYLQRGTDAQNNPQLGIAQFKDVFWGPTDALKLNAKDILFSVRLRNDSQVVKVIMDGGTRAAGQGAAGTSTPAPAPQAATSTAK